MMAKSNVVPLETSGRRQRAGVHMADSAVESVVAGIRGLIDAQNLGVGDSLPSERELCELFASSRNTVREAMRILKTYGVVDVRPKVGAIIIDRRMDAVFDLYSFNTLELSRETFLDTQGLRQLIEVGSIETIFERVTAEDMAALRSINEIMNSEDTVERAAILDFKFHARLVAILGNRQIDEMYRIMKPVMLRIMENGLSRRKFGGENYGEHAGIVDALEARGRIAYQYRMTTHLEAGLALFKDDPEAEQ
jgi:GntR family transcriptional repressor for pyruvate dehydrogenase complex